MMQEFVDQINKSARRDGGYAHGPAGEIKSYDPDKGVATVLPKAKFTKPDGGMMDFPEISGVPVMFPAEQNVTIAWPIKKGDGCLLVFSEQALDYWMYGKETGHQAEVRLDQRHCHSNLTSGGNSTMKLACDEDAVAIAAGDTKAKITPKTAELTLGSAKGQKWSRLVQVTVGGTVLEFHPTAWTSPESSRSRAASPQGMMSRHPTAVSALQTTSTGATAAA